MEFFREHQNQIQADVAYRLGRIAQQYSQFDLPHEERFTSTLDLCILQYLLTHCLELLRAMTRNERKRHYLNDDLSRAPLWGLKPDMVVVNTFRCGALTASFVLERMRHALSHPTVLDINSRFPSTGYMTIPDGSGNVAQFCVVNSPDTKGNQIYSYDKKDAALQRLEKAIDVGDIPKDVEIISDGNDRFCFGLHGKPFVRIFRIDLSPGELHELVIGLTNHLAQPVREAWDGMTIQALIT